MRRSGTRTTWACTALCAAGFLCAAWLGACGAASRAGSESKSAARPHSESGPAGAEAASPYVFPLVERAAGGLEVQWWVTDDGGGAVGAALYDLADGAAPLPPDQARAMIENGLRVVRLRVESLGALQARLPAVRALERTWFGGVLDYKPLFVGRVVGDSGAGAATPPGTVLLIDGMPERVPHGVLRLIGRAWSAPSQDGDVLRFESAVQLQTSSRDAAMAALNLKSAGPRSVVEEGRVFASMVMEAALTPGYAYVIAPESPGVEWRGAESKRRATDDEAPEAAGPVVRPLRTVGEAMMSFEPGEAGAGLAAPGLGKKRLKAVVVLVPR